MILTAEGALQALTAVSPRITRATLPPHVWSESRGNDPPIMIQDPRLGHCGNPLHPAHDRLGYHNASLPDAVDFVALGDSQTYGPIGKPEEAWPAVLAGLTGNSVYNMGIGGWDPVEYFIVLDDAFARRPTTILLGLYLGNDLFGAFRAVYLDGTRPDLATPGAREAIASWEATAPLTREIDRLVLAPSVRADHDARLPEPFSPRRFLSTHSRLYGALRWCKHAGSPRLFPEAARRNAQDQLWREQRAWAARHTDKALAFEHAGRRTVLTPAIRLAALNLHDPRIDEGLQITLRVLQSCAARCRDTGVNFAVLLIPTKESVFAALREPDVDESTWLKLIKYEREACRRIMEFLHTNGIRFVDARAALYRSLSESIQPYPITRDGHPNTAGHQALAHAAAELLTSVDQFR